MLQCVAVMDEYFAFLNSDEFNIESGVLQCDAVCCSVLQCVAAWCSVVQRVAVCCSVSQCVAAHASVYSCA